MIDDPYNDDSGPSDLPSVPTKSTSADKGRKCKQCGREARVVTNHTGRQAYCGPCGIDWPLGPPVASTRPPPNRPRGISKRQEVTPDWGMLHETFDEEG